MPYLAGANYLLFIRCSAEEVTKKMRILLPLTLLIVAVPTMSAAGQTGKTPDTPSLKGIHRVFVEKMDNDLDQYIRAEITKQFKGKLLVVLQPEDADAIMAGVSEHQTGTRAAVTGRWLGLHDTATGTVSVLDKEGKVVLWSSEAGDRSIWWGYMKRGGPRKVADRLVHNLKNAMDAAK